MFFHVAGGAAKPCLRLVQAKPDHTQRIHRDRVNVADDREQIRRADLMAVKLPVHLARDGEGLQRFTFPCESRRAERGGEINLRALLSGAWIGGDAE